MELSYTMLKSLMACEYSYYLRYVKHVPVQEGSATAYGTAVHQTIKIGYENQLERDDWAKIFKKEWLNQTSTKNLVFNDDQDYLKKFTTGQELVLDYYDKFVKKAKPPKQIEMFFGRDVKVEMGGHVLVGVFDQISAKDIVIDYKTGAKPTQADLDCDLQFTIYSYAYRQIFGKEEAGLALRHLGTMKDMVTTRTQADFDMLAGEIAKLEKKLKQQEFLRNLSRDCSYCFFLKACLGKERKVGRWAYS